VPVLILDVVDLASNGSQQMLPGRAGKSRYGVRSRSPGGGRDVAESVADPEFGAGGRAGERQLHELSVALEFLVKRATGAHPHLGGSVAANCAALGMQPMGEHPSTWSAVDPNEKQPSVRAACEYSR
jgi:hypothetical protein